MASSNDAPEQRQQGGRKEAAIRVAKYGLVAGLVAGLFSGGGFSVTTLLMGAKFAGGAALIGAVAGNRTHTVLDKVAALIPGLKPRNASEAEQQTAVEPEIASPSRVVLQEQTGPSTQVEEDLQITPPTGYRSVGEMNVSDLEAVRASAKDAVDRAGEGMDPDASVEGLPEEWRSRHASGKRPTHGGSAALN